MASEPVPTGGWCRLHRIRRDRIQGRGPVDLDGRYEVRWKESVLPRRSAQIWLEADAKRSLITCSRNVYGSMLAGELSPVDRRGHEACQPEQIAHRLQLDAGRQCMHRYSRESDTTLRYILIGMLNNT